MDLSPAIGLLLVLTTLVGAAEPEPPQADLLKNGALALVGDAATGWRSSAPLVADATDVPPGVASAVRVAVAAGGQHGQIVQRHAVTTPGQYFAVAVWARSTINRGAYLQVKRYGADRKELDRMTLGYASDAWTRISGTVDAGDAAAIEVLLRWNTEERFDGGSVHFAQASLSATAPTVRVALVGDSTVQNYPANDARQGWGQALPDFLAAEVHVANHAAGGRSSSTFRSEGRWDAVLADKPQVVLIQFGHNDSHDRIRPEAVDASTAFPDNLRRYVAEAKTAGISVVLVTPPPRRVFHSDGRVSTSLAPYAQAIRDVALETATPCIDLFALGSAELARRGEAPSALLFCSDKDRSHFSAAGAQLLARWIAEGLQAQDAPLRELCRDPSAWPAPTP